MSSNPTFKPSEGKREEFRKYLEKNGVMDALTKVLVNLYEEPEKPEDALEYIRDRLAIQAGLETHNQMKTKLDECEGKIEQLEQEIQQLKSQESPPPPPKPAEEESGEPVDNVPPSENQPAEEVQPAEANPDAPNPDAPATETAEQQ